MAHLGVMVWSFLCHMCTRAYSIYYNMYLHLSLPHVYPCRCPSSEKKEKGERDVRARAQKEKAKAKTKRVRVSRVRPPGALARGTWTTHTRARRLQDVSGYGNPEKKQNKHNKPTLKTMTRCPRVPCAMHGVRASWSSSC